MDYSLPAPKPVMAKATVLAHHYLTTDVITVRLGLAAALPFQAGQFLVLDVAPNQSRSYSICSPPSCGDYLELCVKLLSDGPGSNYLRNLKPGDQVSFRCPFGKFFLSGNHEAKLLFVATATGLAPVHAMLDTLAEQKSRQTIKLLFGVRNEEQIFFRERLDRLAKLLPNFAYQICLSQPQTTDSTYYEGRVTDYLKRHYELDPNWEVYLCGNQGMILDTVKILTAKQFPQAQIYTETFY